MACCSTSYGCASERPGSRRHPRAGPRSWSLSKSGVRAELQQPRTWTASLRQPTKMGLTPRPDGFSRPETGRCLAPIGRFSVARLAEVAYVLAGDLIRGHLQSHRALLAHVAEIATLADASLDRSVPTASSRRSPRQALVGPFAGYCINRLRSDVRDRARSTGGVPKPIDRLCDLGGPRSKPAARSGRSELVARLRPHEGAGTAAAARHGYLTAGLDLRAPKRESRAEAE